MSPTTPGPASPETAGPPLYRLDPEDIPNLDELVTEDDSPVDSIFTEKQQRLLTERLYSPWAAPVEGGAFLALANVGWFYKYREPPLVPDVPGMREMGLPQYNLEFWYGMFLPAGTPPAIVKKVFEAPTAAMKQPSVKAALARDGTEVSISASPEQFAAFLVDDGKFWVNLVKTDKVKVD